MIVPEPVAGSRDLPGSGLSLFSGGEGIRIPMLNRRTFLVGLTTVPFLAGPLRAQDFASAMQARLEREGFAIESIGRTLLGRVRILARSAAGQREIILNPRTGEVLRDLWLTGGNQGSSPVQPKQDGSGDDDNDDNDDDDDDDDEDNSGHGSGSSGQSGGDGDGD